MIAIYKKIVSTSSLYRMKPTSDFLSTFSSVGMLQKDYISIFLDEKNKSYGDIVSTVFVLGNTNGDGGILVCCDNVCKYADGWRRLDKLGVINR